MKTAFAAMSGLVALVGFVMRQWLRYQRQSLKYQKELTDNIYFRNVNNNAGIFDYMIGAAEEQECKEAFLAYYFLRTATTAPTQAELDARIEQWLAATFAVDVDFEVDDALGQARAAGPAHARRRTALGAGAEGDARAARPRVGRLLPVQRGAGGGDREGGRSRQPVLRSVGAPRDGRHAVRREPRDHKTSPLASGREGALRPPWLHAQRYPSNSSTSKPTWRSTT